MTGREYLPADQGRPIQAARSNGREIDEPEERGDGVPAGDPDQDRDDGEEPPQEDRGNDGDRHGNQRDRDIVLQEGDDFLTAAGVAGAQPRHLDANRRQSQPDYDDDGADHHGRHEPVEPRRAGAGDDQRDDGVDEPDSDDPSQRRANPVVAAHRRLDREDRGDVGEGRAEVGGDLAAGNPLKEQRAEARREQGKGRIEAGQDRDQDGCAKHSEDVL